MRRKISDAEFETARINRANQKMIAMVCGYFANALGEDDLRCCGDIGLWRCLVKHRHGGKQAFTSSLYQFVKWECLNAIKRDKKMYNMTTIDDMGVLCGSQDNSTINRMILKDCLDKLRPLEKRVVRGRMCKRTYQDIANNEGYSKQGIKYVYDRAIQKMGDIVDSGV